MTGGAGFVGSHLTDSLLFNGQKVIVLDNLINGKLDNLINAKKHDNFKFIKGDILNISTCNEAMKGVDIVYHLACLGVRHSIHSPKENHNVKCY